MNLELPPPCAKCGKPILFVPFSVTIVDGAYATFHNGCVPLRQDRIAGIERAFGLEWQGKP